MIIQQSIQNTWRQEGLFHILPSFALYHSTDMMTDDYGFILACGWMRNLVAKHAHKFNKAKVYRDRTKYTRKIKRRVGHSSN